ncbi:MAG TPA: ATP-binding protein [Gemmatimonadaceae bacterium]|nr:ATP-binding protein [Gemmatimonadaceae bacterium]
MSAATDSRFPIATSPLIRYRLPRGIVILLSAALAIVVSIAYLYLTSALLGTAARRAQTASNRLAASLAEQAKQSRVDAARVGSDTTLQRAVIAPAGEAGEPARIAAGQMLTARAVRALVAIRLLDSAHHEVMIVGQWPTNVPMLANAGAARGDSVDLQVGPFQAEGDTVYYTTTFPIRIDEVVVGSVSELRRISDPRTAKVFADLVGSDASLLLGARNGGVWTNLEKPVSGPTLPAADSGSNEYRAADGGGRIGSAAPVAHTPWIAWVEFPSDVILAPAHRFLIMIGAVAFVVLVAGGLGGWLFSRRIAIPLEEVSAAAEGIAAGDLSRRVVARDKVDELGRLATSFNSMATQVEDAHHGLEHRVADRTAELQAALAELETAQEELVRKERLATLGQLAGSVGHELRNPLGVMTNSLYLLSMVAPAEPPLLREYLGIIKGQVTLSEKIVGDLLDFARVKMPSTERFPLRAIVSEQLARAGNLTNLTVSCDESPDLPFAVADRTQVGQIVLNLLTNAVQAVGDSAGSITVRSRLEAPGNLRLEVIDTGCGIPPANIDRIFDPLFTTKARGIGLGLSVSRQLARVNGGDILVTSEVGVGSTFALTLPADRATS